MNQPPRRYNDIEDYISTFSDEERSELAEAEAAIELAIQLYHARHARGLTQAEAGALAGFKQQMVSKLERPGANVEIATVQKYLNALGYHLKLSIEDVQTGKPIDLQPA